MRFRHCNKLSGPFTLDLQCLERRLRDGEWGSMALLSISIYPGQLVYIRVYRVFPINIESSRPLLLIFVWSGEVSRSSQRPKYLGVLKTYCWCSAFLHPLEGFSVIFVSIFKDSCSQIGSALKWNYFWNSSGSYGGCRAQMLKLRLANWVFYDPSSVRFQFCSPMFKVNYRAWSKIGESFSYEYLCIFLNKRKTGKRVLISLPILKGHVKQVGMHYNRGIFGRNWMKYLCS